MSLPLITLLLFTAGPARPTVPTVTLPPAAVTLGTALDALRPQTGLTLATTIDPTTTLKLDRRDGTVGRC